MSQEDADSPVAVGQNRPLIHGRVVWISDIPLTEGQLRGKRDTFWDTAPVYEGRKEIWEALRAAADAADTGDYGLAQAILDGANISIPTGQLTEAYDELGNRYVIPPYCLNPPVTDTGVPSEDQPKHAKPPPTVAIAGTPLTFKVRLSTTNEDVSISVQSTATIDDLKIKLCAEKNIQSQKITMLYSGRVLANNLAVGELNIPKGYVIQAIVSL